MATEGLISQLGYLGIGVRDIAAWEDFGTEVVGYELAQKLADGTLYFRMDDYHHRFIVEPTGEDDLKYIGLMAPSVTALKEIQARLQAAGVEVEDGSPEECAYRKVVRFITFKDPDGLRVEVFNALDVNTPMPFHSSRPISGFHAGTLGLGHIGIAVKDIDTTETFYRDVLGFGISDYGIRQGPDGTELKMTFMHVNPREHSVVIANAPNPRRLGHWMTQVEGLDDVGITYDRVREKGIEVVTELGRHYNDQMVSFYMKSPSGFQVEYGFGGQEIDPETWEVKLGTPGSVWGHSGRAQQDRERRMGAAYP